MKKNFLSWTVILWLGAVALSAQQGTADLGGKVTDASGAALPGVAMVLTNEESGIVREVTTTGDGSYFVSQMVPGRYRLSAKLEGFKALERRGVVLTVGQTTNVDLSLEVGQLAETITVTGEAPLIDVNSAEIGGHISASEIADLPAGSRSYMAFVGNVPGARFVPAAGFLNDTMIANGQPAAANNVSMDGATNIDDLRGSNVGGQARVPNEALQEVQVITNQFDAEYGRASGAVINAVTKSGTNSVSGAAFGFFTGKSVIARDYFTRVNDLPEPDAGKSEWGGTVGGPIFRNKFFFFVTFERVTAQRNQSASFPTRPSLSYSSATDEGAWNTMWRLDHQVSPKHSWAFRWLREYAPQFNIIANQETKTSNDDETDLDETLVGTWTTVLSNTMVNTVRLGATLEETVHSNELVRSQKSEYGRCVPCPADMNAAQINLPPRLDYSSFDIQADDTQDFSIDDAYSIENTFSWFVPDKAGRHDFKFGAKYTYIWISNPNNANANGTYIFSHDREFNPTVPNTYPERMQIRVPGILEYEMIGRTYELYAQDKWQIRPNLTFSVGVRYDRETTPINEIDNPLFSDPSKYPVDRNNIAPRLGVVWNPDGQGRSVVRGGYGMFYDRTLLGTLDDFMFATKYSTSFIANFPVNGQPDPGFAAGRLPDEPVLRQASFDQITPQNRALINATYPPGSTQRNTGTVVWDDPERKQPYFHQSSVGYERELRRGLSVSADYVSMRGRDMFINPDLNIATRLNTSRTGPIIRTDPFGILNPSLKPGEAPYVGTVRLISTTGGYSDYDALNLSVEKRQTGRWSLRAAYSFGYSRGVVRNQADSAEFQVGTDLNLDDYFSDANVDRSHVGTISGRWEVPGVSGLSASMNLRLMSGEPFTIHDTNFDLDQNAIALDPVPAGTYQPFPEGGSDVMRDVENEGGRNGARGPGFQQIDIRVGYRARLGGRRTLDVFGEVFNLTDHANFQNPSGDMRIRSDFLRLARLIADTGLPRQAQLGIRFGF